MIPSFDGNLLTNHMKFSHKKLETLCCHMVKRLVSRHDTMTDNRQTELRQLVRTVERKKCTAH